ncbi:RRQRL motif-containing zinc-binding protein [Streptomyces mayteni]
MLASDWDPTGEEHGGMPTYPWGQAPRDRFATRRQLRAMGLRPGGQPVAAQMIRHRKKQPDQPLVAHLYEIALALPKRTPTLAQEWALDRAMAARQTCPLCRVRFTYCLPLRTLGSCWDCSDQAADLAAVQERQDHDQVQILAA